MYVDSHGHLVISKGYLNNGDRTDIYLDFISMSCVMSSSIWKEENFRPEGTITLSDPRTETRVNRYAVQEARRLEVQRRENLLVVEDGVDESKRLETVSKSS